MLPKTHVCARHRDLGPISDVEFAALEILTASAFIPAPIGSMIPRGLFFVTKKKEIRRRKLKAREKRRRDMSMQKGIDMQTRDRWCTIYSPSFKFLHSFGHFILKGEIYGFLGKHRLLNVE